MLRQTISTASRAVRSSAQRQPLLAARPAFTQTTTPAFAAVARTTIAPRVARWYSAEAEKKDAEAPKNGNGNGNGEAAEKPAEAESVEAQLKKQLEAKEAEVRDWKDKCLRSVADFRNLQDRSAREMKAARDFAIQKFAKDLVDSVDNFERALSMVPEEKLTTQEAEQTEHLKDLVSLYEGLKMTEKILLDTLKNHGLERFDPHGLPFNPNEHEAAFVTPQADKEHNTVFHVQQKGFKLNGRILRPAKVGVVKNK
ncbi:GrpE-domain-containing protein [Podospora fimiseda]|uniref:GrpE protein homolog, mitochondrial n=1 Tax=Podospora fimiseda TaxID=252190 RepID=A0AAN6YRD2_9PEZI|nr:GrpE-domain-containing protein [Podospora fimiseda]